MNLPGTNFFFSSFLLLSLLVFYYPSHSFASPHIRTSHSLFQLYFDNDITTDTLSFQHPPHPRDHRPNRLIPHPSRSTQRHAGLARVEPLLHPTLVVHHRRQPLRLAKNPRHQGLKLHGYPSDQRVGPDSHHKLPPAYPTLLHQLPNPRRRCRSHTASTQRQQQRQLEHQVILLWGHEDIFYRTQRTRTRKGHCPRSSHRPPPR